MRAPFFLGSGFASRSFNGLKSVIERGSEGRAQGTGHRAQGSG